MLGLLRLPEPSRSIRKGSFAILLLRVFPQRDAPLARRCGMHSRKQVLFVQNDERGADLLRDRLRKGGCELQFAKSARRAKELFRRQRFDLVLSELLLSDGTAFQLIPPLVSTHTTVLFSNALEVGCWWMTALLQGQDHTKDPGLLPAEFKSWLDNFLSEDSAFNGSIADGLPRDPSPAQTIGKSGWYRVQVFHHSSRLLGGNKPAANFQSYEQKRRSNMRNNRSDDYLWRLVQSNPAAKTGLGRVGVVIILILALLVFGLFAAALVTPKGNIASRGQLGAFTTASTS